MAHAPEATSALAAWLAVPDTIEKAIAGLEEADLDARGGADRWSIREQVHHVVEANLVACNILLAALAASGAVYDWSWVYPNDAWNERMGYAKAPVRPALEALRALSRHIGGRIEALPDAMERGVQLLDAPGAKLYTRTVAELLAQEVEHAQGHLRVLAEIRGGGGHGR